MGWARTKGSGMGGLLAKRSGASAAVLEPSDTLGVVDQ